MFLFYLVPTSYPNAQVCRGIIPNLVQIFPGEEGLVASVRPQQGGEGVRLLALLPGCAAAVPLQRVVDDVVVVRVFPRQDAGATRAAQRAGHKLFGAGEEENGSFFNICTIFSLQH